MNATAIFALIAQGVSLLPVLIQAGIDVTQRIQQIEALAKGGVDGTITDADLAKVRAQFDADLADFNEPMT